MARWTQGKEGDGTGGGTATWKLGCEPHHRAVAQHLEMQSCKLWQQGNAAKSCSETHHHLPASAEEQPCKSRLLQHSPAHWQSTSRKAGTGYVLGETLPAAREVLPQTLVLIHLCLATQGSSAGPYFTLLLLLGKDYKIQNPGRRERQKSGQFSSSKK